MPWRGVVPGTMLKRPECLSAHWTNQYSCLCCTAHRPNLSKHDPYRSYCPSSMLGRALRSSSLQIFPADPWGWYGSGGGNHGAAAQFAISRLLRCNSKESLPPLLPPCTSATRCLVPRQHQLPRKSGRRRTPWQSRSSSSTSSPPRPGRPRSVSWRADKQGLQQRLRPRSPPLWPWPLALSVGP